MALAVTQQGQPWDDGQRLHVLFKIVASANYVAGGDTADLSPATKDVPVNWAPDAVYLEGQAGFLYYWVPGTTLANGKMKVFQTGAAVSSPFAELPVAAYPAGVTGDTIVGEAIFRKAV